MALFCPRDELGARLLENRLPSDRLWRVGWAILLAAAGTLSGSEDPNPSETEIASLRAAFLVPLSALDSPTEDWARLARSGKGVELLKMKIGRVDSYFFFSGRNSLISIAGVRRTALRFDSLDLAVKFVRSKPAPINLSEGSAVSGNDDFLLGTPMKLTEAERELLLSKIP